MICTSCKTSKPEIEFRFRNKEKGIRQTQCKTCCRRDGKKYYKQNRVRQMRKQIKRNNAQLKWFDAFKETLSCELCPETYKPCLEFHHVNNDRKGDKPISRLRTFGRKRLFAELQKCACLCSNCHRKVHGGVLFLPKHRPYSLTDKALDFESRRWEFESL